MSSTAGPSRRVGRLCGRLTQHPDPPGLQPRLLCSCHRVSTLGAYLRAEHEIHTKNTIASTVKRRTPKTPHVGSKEGVDLIAVCAISWKRRGF